MSTAARPARQPARMYAGKPANQPRHRAPLEVVPQSSTVARASSGAFALFVGAVLAAGLFGLLVLNTILAQGAFTTGDLTRKQVALDTSAQALQQQVAVLDSPQALAVAAQQLGMVVTKNPVFLDLVTGKVWGVPLAGAFPQSAQGTSPNSRGAPGAGVATAALTTKPTTKPSANSTKPRKPVKPVRAVKPVKPTKPGSH